MWASAQALIRTFLDRNDPDWFGKIAEKSNFNCVADKFLANEVAKLFAIEERDDMSIIGTEAV
jgi:hypothetical protein